ncbi:P-loop containing nucleoside triphosphate hydrolase protein [Martensiomyces pterosporus]|nr:P-loop containing nucleoside triphosphate hydrolase protein [Martensiomyces pterosporus]
MREAKRKVQETARAETSLISHIVRLLAPECWLFLGVAMTAVGAAIVNLWTPIVTGDLINVIARSVRLVEAMDESVLEALKSPAKKLFVLFFANGLLTFAHTTLVTILGERIGMRLHTMAMNTLLSHDLSFFDSAQSGELVSRLTMDVAEFQSTFKKIITQGLKSATLSAGVLYQLLRLSPQLSLTLLSTMPVAYFGLAYYGRFLRVLRKESREWESISTGIASEAIGNIRTVRSLSAESAELSLYKEVRSEASVANNRFGFHMGVFRGLTNTSIGTMVLVVLYNGGRLVTKGDMTPGDLMAFMIATQSAQKALDSLGSLMGQGVKAKSAITRVLEVINLTPAIPRSGGVRLGSVAGHIRFMDVDFSYPSRPDTQVLSRFNLDIPAGQVVALCGLSGSGKSTVASLLERFYDPVNGEIWLDACPLTKLDPSWHRAQIGFIPQEPALFSTSIRENLRLANPQATDAQVEDACRKANAHDFVTSFPRGYDTIVGERGTLLSGGQKQRLSIARAILRDPKILILDEATSSLDAESERLVQTALDRLMVGRTVLVIAHRLTTIRNADRIVVMGKVPGHIIEQGTHDELLARKGAYYRLYTDAQSS